MEIKIIGTMEKYFMYSQTCLREQPFNLTGEVGEVMVNILI
jgi:hypothetical protein